MASGDVVLSAALRNNLLSLQSTQRQIDTTQLRLATGLKVNSALDGPQNFFTAQSLNNRASDLTRLLDGISQSIRTIEVADTAVTSLSSLVDQAESIALEAQTELRSAAGFTRVRGDVDVAALGTSLVDGVNVSVGDTVTFSYEEEDGDVGTITHTFAANETIDDVVATINGAADINGDDAGEDGVTARVTAGGQIEIQANSENALLRVSSTSLTSGGIDRLGLSTVASTEGDGAGGTIEAGFSISGSELRSNAAANTALSGNFEASQLLGAGANDAGFLTAADDVQLDIVVDGEATTISASITDTDSIQSVVDAVNSAGVDGVTASFDTDTGEIVLSTDGTIGQVNLQYTGNAASVVSFGFGGAATVGAVGVGAANYASQNFTFDGVTTNVDQLESDYNNVRDQINQLVEDASYRGVNLLNGDNLTTFFNEDRSNTLTTEGTDFTALGLGLAQGDFTNVDNIQDSINQSKAALESVRRFGSSIANDLAIIQVRQQFTEGTINTLKAGANDLTVADLNEEGANLLSLQTRQQLGVTSLSLAAQSQQSVLRLF